MLKHHVTLLVGLTLLTACVSPRKYSPKSLDSAGNRGNADDPFPNYPAPSVALKDLLREVDTQQTKKRFNKGTNFSSKVSGFPVQLYDTFSVVITKDEASKDYLQKMNEVLREGIGLQDSDNLTEQSRLELKISKDRLYRLKHQLPTYLETLQRIAEKEPTKSLPIERIRKAGENAQKVEELIAAEEAWFKQTPPPPYIYKELRWPEEALRYSSPGEHLDRTIAGFVDWTSSFQDLGAVAPLRADLQKKRYSIVLDWESTSQFGIYAVGSNIDAIRALPESKSFPESDKYFWVRGDGFGSEVDLASVKKKTATILRLLSGSDSSSKLSAAFAQAEWLTSCRIALTFISRVISKLTGTNEENDRRFQALLSKWRPQEQKLFHLLRSHIFHVTGDLHRSTLEKLTPPPSADAAGSNCSLQELTPLFIESAVKTMQRVHVMGEFSPRIDVSSVVEKEWKRSEADSELPVVPAVRDHEFGTSIHDGKTGIASLTDEEIQSALDTLNGKLPSLIAGYASSMTERFPEGEPPVEPSKEYLNTAGTKIFLSSVTEALNWDAEFLLTRYSKPQVWMEVSAPLTSFYYSPNTQTFTSQDQASIRDTQYIQFRFRPVAGSSLTREDSFRVLTLVARGLQEAD